LQPVAVGHFASLFSGLDVVRLKVRQLRHDTGTEELRVAEVATIREVKKSSVQQRVVNELTIWIFVETAASWLVVSATFGAQERTHFQSTHTLS
jgi:hypothetical protein